MMKLSCVLVLGISFLRVVRGTVVIDYKNNCNALSTCCEGYEACSFSRILEVDKGSMSVDTESCNGYFACNNAANFGGSAYIGSHSCRAREACHGAGQHTGFFSVGDNGCSCADETYCHACSATGFNNGHATIGDGSCNFYRSCMYAGNTNGYLEVGTNSCRGRDTCMEAGYIGNAKIGSNSCQEEYACYRVGRESTGIIGNNSCNGNSACRKEKISPDSFTVGDNSCNGENVCRCLTGEEIVPHNSCNKFGQDECCIDSQTKGNKDLTQSIQFNDDSTQSISLTYDHWEITTMNNSIEEDRGRIKLEFNISNRDYSTQVLQDDCERNFTGVAKNSISFIDIPLNSSGEFIQYDTIITINHTALVNDGTYWNIISDTLGSVEFCVLTELYLNGTKETVNFLSNVVNVTIDTDGNFEASDIAVSRTGPEESNVSVDYSTYLDAYQCTPDNLTEKKTKVYSQGSILVVCVKGDRDIVEVETIKQISVYQGSDPPFEYISESSGYNAAIVTTECQDDNINRICSAQLRLLGRFFTSESPENLEVTGSVTLIFPSNRARRLSNSDFVPRYLQDVSDTGAFNIDAELEKIVDSVNSQSILSGNAKYYLSVAFYYVLCLVWYIV